LAQAGLHPGTLSLADPITLIVKYLSLLLARTTLISTNKAVTSIDTDKAFIDDTSLGCTSTFHFDETLSLEKIKNCQRRMPSLIFNNLLVNSGSAYYSPLEEQFALSKVFGM
jgi:hypothetical protein